MGSMSVLCLCYTSNTQHAASGSLNLQHVSYLAYTGDTQRQQAALVRLRGLRQKKSIQRSRPGPTAPAEHKRETRFCRTTCSRTT